MKLKCAITAAALLTTSTALAGPPENMSKAIAAIQKNLKAKIENTFDKKLCRDQEYCEAYAGSFQVSAYGKIVSILPAGRDKTGAYIKTCAAALAGIANIDPNTAMAIAENGIAMAASEGKSKQSLGKIQFEWHRDYDDRMECKILVL